MDFHNLDHPQDNKLDRTVSSRMGWSDISVCLHGPVVGSLHSHFVQRWNFIYNEKYDVRSDTRYSRLPPMESMLRAQLGPGLQQLGDRYLGGRGGARHGQNSSQQGVSCQIARSCTKWSHGVPTEHSIQNAYCEVIRNSQHFVYIENQFFITATGNKQGPVKNQIGAAIVERIVRAARNGERYKIIVLIPSVPAFAGDLKDDSSLGTRAIMEFQYNSINRGHGHSIMEMISKEGIDPNQYITFYNLRNYDRINASGDMRQAEKESGVKYDQARREHDDDVGAGYGDEGEGTGAGQYAGRDQDYQQYQQAAQHINRQDDLGSGHWDSVSSCYMQDGQDIRSVPWKDGDIDEIDAFVSEELYIHTKVRHSFG